MRVLLAVLLIGIAGCGGEETSPADVATPSSSAVTPVKAENAEAGAPKTKVDELPAQTLAMKETNNTDWIFEALAVRLGENEVDHKQIVNTFGPLVPAKERFLCRWLEKGKLIEMVGEMRQSTTQGDQLQRMYMVCRYDPETNIFVQTVNVDGKSKPGVDLTWNRKTSGFEAEHSLPEPVDARANLSFKWTDNKTLKGNYRIVQGEKVLLHTVITGQKTKPTANNQEFDKLKSSILAAGVE